jgi:hypothetical protein
MKKLKLWQWFLIVVVVGFFYRWIATGQIPLPFLR